MIRYGRALLAVAAVGLLGARPGAAVFSVTSVADAGAGTLRQAMLDALAAPVPPHAIQFNLPGPGPHVIALQSALPAMTVSVGIRGDTQPGYLGEPLIEVDGAGIPTASPVFTLSGGNSQLVGLAISRGPDAGVRVNGAGLVQIYSCRIGTDVSGTLARGNATDGVVIEDVADVRLTEGNNGNIIAANGRHGVFITGAAADATRIQRCHIGTNPAGAILGNGGWGVLIDGGSDSYLEDNVIGNNAAGGLRIQGAAPLNTICRLSHIGLFRAFGWSGPTPPPLQVLPNNGWGIHVASGSGHRFEAVHVAHNSAGGLRIDPPVNGVPLIAVHAYSNGGPNIDLNGDGPSVNDVGDLDGGANGTQNHPVITSLIIEGAERGRRIGRIQGYLSSTPLTSFGLDSYYSLDAPLLHASGYAGAGPSGGVTTDASGYGTFDLVVILPEPARSVTVIATENGSNNSSEYASAVAPEDIEVNSGSCGLAGLDALLVFAALLGARRRWLAVA